MADHSTDPTPDAAVDPAPDAEAQGAGIAALKRDRDDLYDRLLRKSAEFDNYRKRVDRERREQANETVVSLLLEVLVVVDDFERALGVDAHKDPSAYRKGVEMIHTKLQDLLRKQGVKPIDSIGRDFDPALHQAVLYDEGGAHRDGEIIAELQRGYHIGERLLRAAMVKVAKA
jgi:molecular chaperone GrpE